MGKKVRATLDEQLFAIGMYQVPLCNVHKFTWWITFYLRINEHEQRKKNTNYLMNNRFVYLDFVLSRFFFVLFIQPSVLDYDDSVFVIIADQIFVCVCMCVYLFSFVRFIIFYIQTGVRSLLFFQCF